MSTVEILYTKIFINNQWCEASNGKTFPVMNPSTGEEICQVQEATRVEVDKAVEAARQAFDIRSSWRRLEPAARGQLMRTFASLLRRDLDYLSRLETLNNGKPVEDSRMDINLSADCIDYYAGWVDKITGETIPGGHDSFIYTRHEPVGVCGQIIPWNYPIMMLAWKLGPALACGNVIILKPAEQTPLTALYCAALIKEAGFPPGAVNILPGDGSECGHAMAMHEHIDKIAFTGSVAVGKKIQQAAAKSNLKRVSLELGGKSPLIICEDADLDFAVRLAHRAIFANAAQNCTAGSRTFVHEKVYEEFLRRSVELVQQRIVGDPFDTNTRQGPQISESQLTKIMNYIQSGKNAGAKLEYGGERVGCQGYFVQPTIFSGVQDDMDIAREEIFGPVMSVLKFHCYDEVIQRANDTCFGLGAGVVTNDLTRGLRFAQELQAGSVWINDYDVVCNQAPFGGFKQSGHGRELGRYGLEEYYEVKTVVVKLV